jgi:nitrite reductase (NADH) small subunit
MTGSLTWASAGEVAEPRWETVCRLDRLQPERGVAAMLGGRQVALFRVSGGCGDSGEHDENGGSGENGGRGENGAAVGPGGDAVYAIDNVDPCSGVPVLSRGIVGDRGGEPTVASPLYKQAFSLVSGRCLDEPDRAVAVYRVRLSDGWVQVEVR